MKACITMIVLAFIVLTAPPPTRGENYYISPGGLDTNDGLTASYPWKTFTHAIPELQPGDTLILLDGVYSVSGGTGLPAITCGDGGNANQGTEEQPITIRAENERGALLQSTGDWNHAFYMNGCSYWNVVGLRGKSADLPEGEGGKPYSVFTITKSDHIVLQRLLASHPNRYGNSQAIQVSESSDSLVEECEAYYFHRHGISIYRSDHITVRRCYVNSRDYSDIPGGCPSHQGAEGRGDEGMTLYQTTDSIVENCISEGNEFFGNSGQRNQYLGSISLNNLWGFAVGHHCCDSYMEATDNTYINNVTVGSQYHGFLTQSDVNVFVDHLTSINSTEYYGLYANNKYSDNRSSDPVVTWMVEPSLAVQNSLFLNNNTYGIRVNEDHVEDYAYRKFEYLNSYGHGQNYGPGLDPSKPEDVMEELSEVDPQMCSCIVFIPKGSPMKGAGKNGADIGANTLYRYEDGILTDQPLWDPATGAFPCGAIVPGLNDVPGSSCFDVHERLNVNANGCSLELDPPLRTLISGLGSYPSSGGWMETFAMDYSHADWLRVGWSPYNSANGEARLATGDIDGDGRDEVVLGLGPVGSNPSIPGGWFQVLDDDHTPLTWGRIHWATYNSANGEGWPACGDVDGDGKDEIVIGFGSYPTQGGWCELFDYDAGVVNHKAWLRVKWETYNDANGETRPACGDIDGDGRDEIVIGLGQGGYGWLEIFDDAASGYAHLAWPRVQWGTYNSANGETRPACGDVDGDGKDEIVIGFGSYPAQGGWCELFDYDAGVVNHKAWLRVKWGTYNDANGETRPACGDIDGDGQDEIVIGLGQDGEGWFEVFDDASAGYAHLGWPRVHWGAYNSANGETWPAVKK